MNALDPRRTTFELAQDGRLAAEVDGVRYHPVKLRLCFPLSRRDTFIMVLDPHGSELGIIKHLRSLDRRSARVVAEEIERTYFIPRIKRIYSIRSRYGTTSWDVETDRGRKQFEVIDREHIRRLSNYRMLIKDCDGNRYLIRDWRRLDPRSREILEMET